MAGIPFPDPTTQQVGQFGVLGNTGLSDLPNFTRANVEYSLKQQLKSGAWKDSSDEFWTGVDPDGVSPWSANYTKVISETVKGSDDSQGTTLPELTQDLNNWINDKWSLLAAGSLGEETGTAGTSVFVNFASYSDGTALPAEWDMTYSGSGTGQWGVQSGKARWYPVNDADRSCIAIYGDKTTVTDYQLVGFALAESPVWFNSSVIAKNYLLGRCNAAGTEYVAAQFGKYNLEIFCVAGGTTTVLATDAAFVFKPNVTYWLQCGTSSGGTGLATIRVMENNVPILSVTDLTYHIIDASHRFGGMAVDAKATGFGTTPPGRVAAWGFGDNQPAVTVGSGGLMYRTSTSGVNVSSGANLLATSFYDVADTTADIVPDITNGKFTVTMDGWYTVEWRSKTTGFSETSVSDASSNPINPFPMHILLYKNGSAYRAIGDVPTPWTYDIADSGTADYRAPEAVSGSSTVYLAAGDYVQIGYDADSSKTSCFTGDAGGLHTYFAISLTNRSRE